LKKGIVILILGICIVVCCIVGYQLLHYYKADTNAENDFAAITPPGISDNPDAAAAEDDDKSDFETLLPFYENLREQNGDMVGWLRIPGTQISYPVMQTINSPEYYLDKDFEKRYSVNGSLFASSVANVDEPSDVVVIHGHRSKTGSMFGSIGDFLKEDFLREHETIIFDTFTGRNVYKIFCLFTLDVGPEVIDEFEYFLYSDFANEEDFNDFMYNVKINTEIEISANSPEYGDKLLLLSTCEYHYENGRLVVVAVRGK